MKQLILLSLFSGPFFTIKNGLIVALIVGFLCLFLLIALVWFYLATRKTDDDVKDIIKDSIKEPRGRIHEAIRKMVLEDDEVSRRFSKHEPSDKMLSKAEIERIVQQKVDKALEGFQMKQCFEFDQPTPETTRPAEDVVKSNSLVLYATCVDENKHGFYTVTTLPDKDTIFVLEINPEDQNEATFTVYDRAFKKVIGEQGYLKEGCAIENPGMNTMSRVKTIEPGLTCRKNGEWMILEKAKVKFE